MSNLFILIRMHKLNKKNAHTDSCFTTSSCEGTKIKVSFFLLKFPLSSETFVLNQIVEFIKMGYEVNIIALQKGDLVHTHEKFTRYKLADRTSWIQTEPDSKLAKILYRINSILKGIKYDATWRALNVGRYGHDARNLMLSSICANSKTSFTTDVFIAHFGPAGVIASKLRELGVLNGKIATFFHGVDISGFDILSHYTTEYQNLFLSGDMMLPVSNVWGQRLREMGCPERKINVSRMGVNLEEFTMRGTKIFGDKLEIISVARLTEKKGLHVAIEACRLLKIKGKKFHYHIIGKGPLEQYLRTLINRYELHGMVEISGFKPNHEVKSLLDLADIFLLPSLTASNGDMEGIPVALMEAMAVGIPVVSTRHSGIPELITHGKSGWLVPENDPTALALQLDELSSLSASTLNTVVEYAREIIECYYDQKIQNQQLGQLLRLL